MASIRVETPINARPAYVWAALRDFGSLLERLAPGFATDTRLDRTRFVWIADLLPNELAERTHELMQHGSAVIRKTLEGSVS
jgi:hypothetical protein